MTIRAHRDAVITALSVSLPGAVFKSYSAAAKDASVSRYAVLFIARTRRDRTRYTGPQSRDTFTLTVHCVGTTEDEALYVQERVDELTGLKLPVAGRHVHPVEFVTGKPPELDDDSTQPLWYSTSQFDLTSDPA